MGGKHVTDVEIKKLHQPPGGAAEKGCLTRHERREEGNLCSHQWQAKLKALDHPRMYNYPKYKSICGRGRFKTAARRGKSGKAFPRDYAFEWKGGFWKTKPTHEGKEWNVNKPGNFDDYRKPYWHNAHHIVPNGALKSAINKTGKTDPLLPNLIKQGLLRGTYNLNDKVNMVILPQGFNVAKALGLPRHLKGDEVPDGEEKELRSHKDYSNRVELKLDSIMMDYEEFFADYVLEDHPPPPDKLSKSKIDNLSKNIFNEIRTLRRTHAGKALSELPKLVK